LELQNQILCHIAEGMLVCCMCCFGQL